MSRPPVTIAILAWNAWESTRACLDSLRPTLGIRDQVVIVDNGSTDYTPRGLSSYPWVEVVTNEANRGFAGGCNDAAARARCDVIIFLNNDTLLPARWIEPLVAAFDDPGVGAAGPRTNFVTGPQLVPEARYGTPSEMRRFARQWSDSHRGMVSATLRLAGFALAVRRSSFEAVGGFNEVYGIGGFEDDDLCKRLTATGFKLLISHESFVHHEGHKTFDANGLDWYTTQEKNRRRFVAAYGEPDGSYRPIMVSACIIAKNEEALITTCLSSLEGLADEVIVYDTGSTDDTVSLARAAGAKVINGYWDDNFSRARNSALSHCSGEWILWIDADETFHVEDATQFRNLLASTRQHIDAWSVRIDNLSGVGTGSLFSHHATRIFRRERCEWIGRLHEQIALRGTHEPIVQATLSEGGWIQHTGYMNATFYARDKAERNLRLARAEAQDDTTWDRGYTLTSLGRSLILAGSSEEALRNLREAISITNSDTTRRLALVSAIPVATSLGRTDEALELCDLLRKSGGSPNTIAALEAPAYLKAGNPQRALDLLDSVVTNISDQDGFSQSAGLIAAYRSEALARLGRPGNAADALLSVLGEEGVLDTHLGSLVEYFLQANRPLESLAEYIPKDKVKFFLAQTLQLSPQVSDRVLEAWINSNIQYEAVLATARTLSPSLPIERALVWSTRLRAAGYSDACPLLAISTLDPDPVNRARAAAVATKMFDDDRARISFEQACAEASPLQLATIVNEVTQLCPELAPIAVQKQELTSRPLNQPYLSIVIPCFNHADLTLNCLESIRKNTEPHLYRIILVDNGSTDATAHIPEGSSQALTVIRNSSNTGFGNACNQGARLASTDYICFLNNDTVVTPGWLEPLLTDLEEDPELAAVQPKLLYPDGRLNDAGGLVFLGGEPWVYGKGHPNPSAPQFEARRAPDYVSGACLLVRKSAFDEVGGFDDRFSPAYFEDTDLSFALRHRGWKLLYEPQSTVIHLEGGTAGTDVNVGIKSFQAINSLRFAKKWEDELSTRWPLDSLRVEDWAHRPQGGFGPGEGSKLRAERNSEYDEAKVFSGLEAGKRRRSSSQSILVMDYDMPVFDRASGGLRLFNFLRYLREAGHSVTFYAAGGGHRRYAERLGRYGIVCYGSDPSQPIQTQFRSHYAPSLSSLLNTRSFDTLIVTPWSLAEQVLPVVRSCAPNATFIVDTNDVHFLRLERQAALTGRVIDAEKAEETRRREIAVYKLADRIIATTEEDAAAVLSQVSDASITVIPNVHHQVDPGPGFAERSGLLFVGNFNHLPNRDALKWWRDAIAPILDGAGQDITLQVIGNDPEHFARTLATPSIVPVGYVASTLPYLHRAKVSVAPLRFGAGMKGKVGEALATGLPVVATSIAIEGMGLVDGEHVLVADTAAEFVEAITRLYTDEVLWNTLRQQGSAHIEKNFGVQRMRDGICDLFGDLELADALV